MENSAPHAMPAQSTDAQQPESSTEVPQQVRLRMVKQAGDRSFGMTLEQRFAVTPHEYAAIVSYIFPDSPADRVGIKRGTVVNSSVCVDNSPAADTNCGGACGLLLGWVLLRINNRSVRGLPVKDVALMFRDLIEVILGNHCINEWKSHY